MVEKIKIQTDAGEQIVTLTNPKGRQVKKGFKLFTKLMNDDGTENVNALVEYLDYLDELSAELVGMTTEELDDLDNEEKTKIVGHYQKKIEKRVDFLKSSLRQANSVPPVTEEKS